MFCTKVAPNSNLKEVKMTLTRVNFFLLLLFGLFPVTQFVYLKLFFMDDNFSLSEIFWFSSICAIIIHLNIFQQSFCNLD